MNILINKLILSLLHSLQAELLHLRVIYKLILTIKLKKLCL